MAPNLFLAIKWMVQPHRWCQHKTTTSPRTELSFSKEPVPGIYATNKSGRQFLVAIKPNGKDQDGIFRHNLEEDSQYYRPVDLNVTAAALASEKYGGTKEEEQLSTEDKSNSVGIGGRYDRAATASKTATSTTRYDITPKSLPEILAQTDAVIRFPPTISDSDDLASHELGIATTLYLTFDAEEPFYSVVSPKDDSLSKSFMHSQDTTAANSIYNSDSNSSIKESRHISFTPLTHPIRDAHTHHHSTTAQPPYHHISNIDMPGYKYLAKPLEVIYSPIHDHRLFKAELKARTFYQDACTRKSCHCGPAGYRYCHGQKERNWVLLDDGESLVCKEKAMRLCKDKSKKNAKPCLRGRFTNFYKGQDTGSANNSICLQTSHSSLDWGCLAAVTRRLNTTSRGKKIGTEDELLFKLVDKDSLSPYYKAQSAREMKISRQLIEERRGRCVEVYYGDDKVEDYVEDYMKVWGYIAKGKGPL